MKHVISKISWEGKTFAVGDLATGDIDNDGDLDFFRYGSHEGTSYELWLNNTVK